MAFGFIDILPQDVDSKLAEAFAPQQALQDSFRQLKANFDTRIHQAQQNSEELNRSIDRLNDMNKNIDRLVLWLGLYATNYFPSRYVKSKKTKALEDYSTALHESEVRSKDLHAQIEGVRRDIAAIDKEINESGATMSNLRDNIIVRRLKEKVEVIDKEIASYDMEEAAKARRNYEDKYQPAKAREQKLNEVVRTIYYAGQCFYVHLN